MDSLRVPAGFPQDSCRFPAGFQQATGTPEDSQKEAQKAARLTRVCADMRADLRALASGTRISRIDDNGERRYLEEGEVAQRVESVRKSLTEECSRG